uniref:Uncharacterized protein n=1 Tax=Ditylenchus dipsaci TaxID=166011 RepID=A0A915DXM4_9BILA
MNGGSRYIGVQRLHRCTLSSWADSTLKSDKEVSQDNYQGRNFERQVVFFLGNASPDISLCWIAALIFFNVPLKLNEEAIPNKPHHPAVQQI